MCNSLLQLVDTQLDTQLTFKGSCLIIPCGAQYKNFFPEIMAPHNHQKPLKDPKTSLLFPMKAVGDFCLMDKHFPGIAGDSLMFCEADLKEQGFHILIYKAENLPTTVKNTYKSSHPPEGTSESSDKAESTSSKTSGTTSPEKSRLHCPQQVKVLTQAKEK